MKLDWPVIFGFAAVVLLAGYILARRQQREGYPFWRAFFLSVLAATGIGLLVVRLLAR